MKYSVTTGQSIIKMNERKENQLLVKLPRFLSRLLEWVARGQKKVTLCST